MKTDFPESTVPQPDASGNPLAAALGLAADGGHILPLCWPAPDGTCGCGRGHRERDVGKAPLTANGVHDATRDPSVIRGWWHKWPTANVGVSLEPSKILFLGPDSPQWQAEFMRRGLPPTVRRVSANTGYLYRLPDGVHPAAFRNITRAGEFDLMVRGYVVAHGVHRTGCAVHLDGRMTELAEAPAWLLDMLEEGARWAADATPLPQPPDPQAVAEAALGQLPPWFRADWAQVPDEDRSGWAYRLARRAVELGVREPEVLAALVVTSAAHRDKFRNRQDAWDDACRAAARALEEGGEPSEGATVAQAVEGGADSLLPAPAPFPLEVLPDPLRRFVEEGAEALNAPPDFLAVPILAVAGAAIGSSRAVAVKAGWVERPSLYAAIVGEPGTVKTPALQVVAEPLFERQRRLAQEYERELRDYRRQRAEWEADARAWESRRRKSEDPGPMPMEPIEPTMGRVFTSDTTVEALGAILAENPRGVLLLRDELTAWVRGMDQYRSGRGADRQFFLSVWSGAGHAIDRKGAAPIFLHRPFLCVVGGLQPDLVGELSDAAGREDGFAHRLLFAYPDPPPRRWTERPLPDDVRAAWAGTLAQFWALKPDGEEPVVLRLTDAAHRAWVEAVEGHYSELNSPDLPPVLRGPWGKLDVYAARLGLILQLLHHPTAPAVEERAVLGAWRLIRYFKAHARRVYRVLDESPEARVLRRVWEFARRKGEVQLRDVVAGVRGVRDADHAEKLLAALERLGFGRWEERQSERGHPALWFVARQ